jgi:hypothetical protein
LLEDVAHTRDVCRVKSKPENIHGLSQA